MVEMFKKPYVLGIDSTSLASQQVSVAELMSSFGANTGNAVFSEALYRALANCKRGTLQFTFDDLEECDVMVIAAANWLNIYEDFGWLADKLENANLPTVIVGLGAQSEVDNEIPRLKEGTLRLIKLISEKSAVISTRGSFTSRVLSHYGIYNTLVTGCPSLLLCGSEATPIRRAGILADECCVLHSTRHLYDHPTELQSYLYRQAAKRNISIVLQSELTDMYYTLRRTSNKEIMEKCSAVINLTYGGHLLGIARYLSEHAHVFFEIDHWIEYLSKKQFSLGSRLHGTIVALIAGTPATLICHDSRTRETAEAMAIPFVDACKIDRDKDLDLDSYYSDEAITRYMNGYARYLYNFRAFFNLNGLNVTSLIA